jgi:hypothetical protein
MKLLKFDRKTFNERFGSKKDCYEHLAGLKWSEGYTCKRCMLQDEFIIPCPKFGTN